MEDQFGAVVQHYREKSGLTQDELARRLNVSQQTVGKWESGKAYPRPKVFANLILNLRIPAGEIMELYSQSKGARSSLSADSDLTLKKMEWEWERSKDLGLPSSVAERVNSQSDDVPLMSPEDRFDNLNKVLREVRPQVEAVRRGCVWSKGIQGGTLGWYVHYLDDDTVANFAYATTPRDLHNMLREDVPGYKVSIRRNLWDLATLRAHLRDRRNYLLIIYMPGYIGMDAGVDMKNMMPNEIVLRRLTAEAALLGLSVFVVNTPQQIASLLSAYGSDEEERWSERDHSR